MAWHVSGISFIRYVQCQKIGKPEDLKVAGSKKSKGHKQNNQSQLK
jgi:hypothetical protein